LIEVYAQNLEEMWFALAISKQDIQASSFGTSQQTAIKNVLNNIPFDLPFQIFHEPTVAAKQAMAYIKSIYDGKDVTLNLSLATTRLPAYTRKVLKATSSIPLGYVASYGSIAKATGGGPRAVGNVMASNPFAPIVPCHRVVRSDFSLGGYGFGLKAKMELLRRERRGFATPKEIAVNGECFNVFPVEHVLRNLPT
jgi:O-6-methylguanine DNA methyltransferase